MQDAGLDPLDCKEQREPLRKRLTRWAPASRFRLGLLRFGGVLLTGVTLLLPTSAAAASFRPPLRPAITPTTMPSSTPTPRPTATTAPRPTATAPATPTTAATSTAVPGAMTGTTTESGPGQTPTIASLWWSVLLVGLGGMVAVLLICGICLRLFARRSLREYQPQPAFPASAHVPSRQRLNQLHHLLPARTASLPASNQDEPTTATLLSEEEDAARPSSPAQELPWSPSPRPPQWLIDAGLLKNLAKEYSPPAPEES